jgi:hypothetical protein
VIHRAVLLAQVAAWYAHPTDASPPANADNQTAADSVVVSNTISRQEAHWGVRQPVPTPPGAGYSSVAAVLERLSHWLDEPTGAVLLSGSGSGNQVVRLDVDSSRVIPTGIPAVEGHPTLRRGYLAYASGNRIWAVAPDGSGTPRQLATGSFLFAANDPAAIWVVDASSFQATKIDGSGRVLSGPLTPPGNLLLDTSAGLVVSGQNGPGIEIWSPTDGTLSCPNLLNTGDGGPFPVAARDHQLAWASGDGRLHLTDVTTCVDRLPGITGVNGGGLQDVGAFSPDGTNLAVASHQAGPQGQDDHLVQLVAVASDRVTTIPIPDFLAPVSAIAWTSDGSRLFWAYSGLFGFSSVVATWHLGDAAAQPLRALHLSLTPPMYVLPPP